MASLTVQGTRILQLLVACTIVLTLFFSLSRFGSGALKDGNPAEQVKVPQSQGGGGVKMPSFSSSPPEPKPANETLDFQEIIYLSMPYRTDRQDQMSLIAAVTGLKLTMIPGVKVDDMHEKAMPGHIGPHDMSGLPELGIWRAHANVWRHIIDNNIQSALIIEDDVDWELNIKEIMGNLRWQLQYNNTIRWGKDVQKGWKEECPYGCDWDELFVGQCGGGQNKARLDLHSIFPEPNSPNISSLPAWTQKEFKTVWNLTESEGIRVISPTWEPICLMGYGLTRMGAMRMLYQIGGWKPFGYPVDNEIAWRTSAGVLSGYTLSPPVITSWRVGGSQDSDNDKGMMGKKVQSEGPSKGESKGMKQSVRRYLDTFFAKNYWEEVDKYRTT